MQRKDPAVQYSLDPVPRDGTWTKVVAHACSEKKRGEGLHILMVTSVKSPVRILFANHHPCNLHIEFIFY